MFRFFTHYSLLTPIVPSGAQIRPTEPDGGYTVKSLGLGSDLT